MTERRPGARARAGTLGLELFAGGTVGVVMIIYSLSFAAVVFSGPLKLGLTQGLAAALLGAAVAGGLYAVFSSIKGAIAAPDTPVIAVLGLMAAGMAATLGDQADTPRAVALVLIAVAFTTVLVALFGLLLGSFKVGNLMRFVPYPVAGGFLMASGLLLVDGGYRVVVGASISEVRLNAGPLRDQLLPLSGAVLFAAVLFVIRIRFRASPVATPLLFAFCLAAGQAALSIFEVSTTQAAADGWFLAVRSDVSVTWPWRLGALEPHDWRLLLDHVPEILAAAAVSAIAVVVNSTGLEIYRKSEVRLDQEYRATGIGNAVSAALGGMPSSFSLNRTVLNEELGSKTRLSALLSAAICAVALGFGVEIIRIVPTPMVGGLLVFLGALATWNTVKRLPPRQSWADYLLTAAIALLIIFVGYIEGFVIGIVAACLTFAVSYSQVGIVKQRLSRATYSSKVQYAKRSAEVLESHGDTIQILRLQGYIFFGTANRLFELVRRLIAEGKGQLASLILDCQLVTGIEASATMSFLKLRHLCDKHRVTLEICAMRPRIARTLIAEGVVDRSGDRRAYASLDEALEEAERVILARYPAAAPTPPSLTDWLAQEVGSADAVAPVMSWLERREFAVGDLLTQQGGPADEIFLIESGKVSVVVTDHGGAELRLRTMTSCTVLGEIGFFGARPRTATVRAETPTVAYRLTRAALHEMQRRDPHAALTLHRLVINTLADRLDFANAELTALDQ